LTLTAVTPERAIAIATVESKFALAIVRWTYPDGSTEVVVGLFSKRTVEGTARIAPACP
jgi:hypothetical protein